MTFAEAKRHLLAGEKVCLTDWQDWSGCYLVVQNGSLNLVAGEHAKNAAKSIRWVMGYRLGWSEVTSDGWALFDE